LRFSDIADIGEDQHWQMLVEKARHGFGGAEAFGEPDIGKGIERSLEIITGAKQRLRAVGGGTGHDADGAAAPAFVEQLHGACRALAGDFQPRNVVADLDRQIDHRLGFALAGLEGEACFAERKTFQIDGVDDAVVAAVCLRAQHFHAQRAGGVVGGGERLGCGDSA
jgi:hypothetical protein